MKKPKQHTITGESLIVRAYPILVQCIEDGVAYGWRRAHKHAEHPGEDEIKAAIERAVTDAICEAFHFADAIDGDPS